MMRPVLNELITVHSNVVREGSRMIVADATIVQQGELRARASAVFLVSAASPPGEVWQPQSPLPVPQARLTSPDGDPPLLRSGESEWTHDRAAGRNADRKMMWQNLIPLIEGRSDLSFSAGGRHGGCDEFCLRNRRRSPTVLMRSCVAAANERTPSSKPGEYCGNSGAAPIKPDDSSRRSTCYRTANFKPPDIEAGRQPATTCRR